MVVRKVLAAAIFSIAVLLAAKGCIPVEDMGEYWDKGTIDPALEGAWKEAGAEGADYGQFFLFVKSDDYYEARNTPVMGASEMGRMPSIHAKTMMVGPHKFLLLNYEQYYKDVEAAQRKLVAKIAEETGEDVNEADDTGMMSEQRHNFKGILQRYTVENNILSIYQPNYEALGKAIEDGEVKGTLSDEDEMTPLRISKLDEETIKFLLRMSNDSKYWEEVQRFKRIESLEKALEEARKRLKELGFLLEEQKCRGKVFDRLGGPVSGAQVQAQGIVSSGGGTYYLPSKIEVIDEVTTDSNGGFELNLKQDAYMGEVTIAAKKDGFSLGWKQWSRYDDSNSVIMLAEAVGIRGQAVNEENVPIAGAEIRGILVAEDSTGESAFYSMAPVDWLVTTTNEQGEFEFSNLPAGAMIQLLAAADGYAKLCWVDLVSREGDHRSGLKIVDGMQDISLVLQREAIIEGTVVDANGSAVGNIDLEIRGEINVNRFDPGNTVSLTSGSDGSFQMGGLAGGRYLVTSPKSSYEEAGTWKAVPSRFFAEAGKTITGKVEVSRGGVLEIVVIDVEVNEPMAEAEVAIRPDAKYIKSYYDKEMVMDKKTSRLRISTWHYGLRNYHGCARFYLPACKYVAEVSTDKYKRRSKLIELKDGETKVFEYEVGDEARTVISVADVEGEPVAGIRPQVRRDGCYLAPTDAQGRSIIGELQKDCIRSQGIMARDPDRNLAGLIIAPEEFDSLHIEVKSGMTFGGRFVDEKGNPIPDIAIRLGLPWGKIDSNGKDYVSDANGYFAIPAIPALPEGFPNVGYVMSGRPKGYSQFCRRDIRAKGDVNFGDLVLRTADKYVCGIVVNEDGEPIVGATVGGYGYGQPISVKKVTTDEKGMFRLDGVTSASITVHATLEPEYRRRYEDCRGGDQDVRIVLEKTIEGVIEVFVVDAESSEPVDGVKVTLKSNRGNESTSAKSDRNGCARLYCNWKGEYSVSVDRKDCRVYPSKLKVDESGRYEVLVEIGKR